MRSPNIPHDDFREGFIVGWQTVRGINTGVLGIPGAAGIHGGTMRFLEGVKAGLRAAGVELP